MSYVGYKPPIFSKFNNNQQEWWRRFYNRFIDAEEYPDGLDGEDIKSQRLRHALCVKMSTQAVYEMNGLAEKYLPENK
jgi:hypothetical protein